MKFLIAFICSLTLLFNNEIDWFRNNFQSAKNFKAEASAFYLKSESITSSDPILLGYKAAGKMLQSKFEKNKQLKKDLFKEGATTLNDLIEDNPKNIELRFIRLAVQQNTPAILKYNGNINDDKQFILSNYKNAHVKQQLMIKDYVLSSNKFTDSEKKSLQ